MTQHVRIKVKSNGASEFELLVDSTGSLETLNAIICAYLYMGTVLNDFCRGACNCNCLLTYLRLSVNGSEVVFMVDEAAFDL